MKAFKIFILGFALIGLASCSDFLEKEPHTLTAETFFNNANELEAFLTECTAHYAGTFLRKQLSTV
jgi:hypothetical protein